MPQHLKLPNSFEYRGETVCKFSATLTVGNQIFFRVLILLDFAYFRSFCIIFRIFHSKDRAGSVRNRFEMFAITLRQPVGVERPVHMCANRQYLSHAGGTLGTDLDIQEVVNSSPALKRERKAHCNKANEPEADIDEFYIRVFLHSSGRSSSIMCEK